MAEQMEQAPREHQTAYNAFAQSTEPYTPLGQVPVRTWFCLPTVSLLQPRMTEPSWT